MIKRYLTALGNYLSTVFNGSTNTGSTAQTATYVVNLKGPAGAVVTLQVILFTHTNGSAANTIDGVSKVLNDTFTKTLNGSGVANYTQVIDVGTTASGNAINVRIQIISTSIGPIGSTNINQQSKVV